MSTQTQEQMLRDRLVRDGLAQAHIDCEPEDGSTPKQPTLSCYIYTHGEYQRKYTKVSCDQNNGLPLTILPTTDREPFSASERETLCKNVLALLNADTTPWSDSRPTTP
jgi:hypothetical protein